jgi:arylsulfatase A-like enzyme
MADSRPNILFIMADDHASHAMSCYGSQVLDTPQLDRIAEGGMRFDNCFCTNSICTPSRAVILTGTYSHVNGVTTLQSCLDNRLTTFPKLLQSAGYQTAIVGKWHLGHGPEHDPRGFDYWKILRVHGRYHDPILLDEDGEEEFEGYLTDITVDLSLDWLKQRDPERPFCLLCHHKAPHRPWDPDEKHRRIFAEKEFPAPPTFDDDYSNRATAAREAKMRILDDLNERDLKGPVPEGLSEKETKWWKYQRYMQDYLACCASIDDNTGRLLDYLDEAGLAEHTIVIYTSDQGFFLGDHGWFDKRFMYEESLRMPFIIRWPREIAAGSVSSDMILNVDFAPYFLDCAGVDVPDEFQGRSIRSLTKGVTPDDWRDSMYYRYWMHRGGGHNVFAHYGVRTKRYKLIYYYADGMGQPGVSDETNPPEWELFDLEKDPRELCSVYDDPAYADTVKELTDVLHTLQAEVGDKRYPADQ